MRSYLVSAEELIPHKHGIHPPGSSPVEQLIEPLGKVCTTFADGQEVAPGIAAVIGPGHSAGHTSYVVTSGEGRRAVVFGDAFHIPAQLTNPGWASRPDVDTERVLTARARITAELENPDTLGFGFHFGDQAFAVSPAMTRADRPGHPFARSRFFRPLVPAEQQGATVFPGARPPARPFADSDRGGWSSDDRPECDEQSRRRLCPRSSGLASTGGGLLAVTPDVQETRDGRVRIVRSATRNAVRGRLRQG
jgi:glyoxylase-like metal-dependent hydrolase (beta-lactamase superfamily II)